MLLSPWFASTVRRPGIPFRLDEPAEVLITDGPFCFSRGPGYLSFARIQGCIASLANSPWAVLLVPATVALVRRRVTEKGKRDLERRSGERYPRHQGRVRRWV